MTTVGYSGPPRYPSTEVEAVRVKFGPLAKIVGGAFVTLSSLLLAAVTYYVAEMSHRIEVLGQRVDDDQKSILAMETRFGTLQQSLSANLANLNKDISTNQLATVKALGDVARSVDAAVNKIEVTNTKLEATNSKLDAMSNRLWPQK